MTNSPFKDYQFRFLRTKGKRPLSFDETYEENQIGYYGASILLEKPFIVYDFDNMEQFEKVCAILKSKNIHPPILKTDRGGHIWFKTKETYRNKAYKLPILVPVDIKCWGTKSCVNVKNENGWREWIQQCYYDDIPEVPMFLSLTSTNSWTRTELSDFNPGNRNETLFRLTLPLAQKFNIFDKDAEEILMIINEYFLKDKLDNREITAMINENVRLQLESVFFEGNKFLHNKMGEYLVKKYDIRKYQNALFGQYENKWLPCESFLDREMRKVLAIITKRQIDEVFHWLMSMVEIFEKNYKYINLTTSMLNLETLELEEFSKDKFTPINLDIDPNRYISKQAQNFTTKIIKNTFVTNARIKLFTEIMGYILVPHNYAQKIFMFVGNGSNGKSFILEKFLQSLFSPYTTSLNLTQFNEPFMLNQMRGAMLNMSADESSGHHKSEVLKKIATGDSFVVNIKYRDPIKHTFSTKFILSCNSLPTFDDTSNGIKRRILPIPFTQEFSIKNGNYDSNVNTDFIKYEEEIKTQLFLWAILGLKNLMHNNWEFKAETEDKEIVALKREFETNNNSVKYWIEECSITKDKLIGLPTSDPYADYKSFASGSGIRAVGSREFITRLKREISIDIKRATVNSRQERVFCEKRS